jgi:hypothetical protein
MDDEIRLALEAIREAVDDTRRALEQHGDLLAAQNQLLDEILRVLAAIREEHIPL